MGRIAKDRRDVYYRKAKELGYRARSAFKLKQLHETFGILTVKADNRPARAVDLCAAPGSWSQVLCECLTRDSQPRPLIVSVDLQEMAPIEGVIQIKGDITDTLTATKIIDCFNGENADIVVCDGAPDVTGLHDIDEYVQSQLLFSAASMAIKLLPKGQGVFVAKIFRGELSAILMNQLKCLFNSVFIAKPPSSRVSSFEAFVICEGSKESHQPLLPGKEITPFLACGDLSAWDSDTLYDLPEDYEWTPPPAPPLSAAYLEKWRMG